MPGSSLLAATLLLAACTGGAAPVDTGERPTGLDWSYPLDDVLRVTHGQVLGTHNSTHIEPDPLLTEEWAYTHQPLDVQLGQLGVRQLELDTWWNPDTGEIEVMHVPYVDEESTCELLLDCLAVMRDWSARNAAHFPLVVLVEPKDEIEEMAMYNHLDELDAVIREGWPEHLMWTPDEQQGNHATLRDSVVDEGWPTLDRLRGEAIFVLLDSGPAREAYTAGLTSVEGRVMFPLVGSEHELAAFFLRDNPTDETIPELAEEGFFIRTRADSGGAPEGGDTSRLEAALASGAHCISTDFPEPEEETGYVAEIPGGEPVRCNPVSAPGECTATALEDPAFVGE